MNIADSSRTLNNQLLSGGAWAFAGRVLLAISGLLLNALLTRLLTPQEVGAYFLTLTLVSASSMIAQLGLDHAVVRLIAESLSADKFWRVRLAVYRVFLLLGLGTIVVSSFVFLRLGRWLAIDLFQSRLMAEVIGLTVVWIAIVAFQGVIAEVFRGFHDIRFASIFGGVFSRIITVVLLVFFWIYQGHASLKFILILSIAAGITNLIVSAILITGKLKFPSSQSRHSNSLPLKEIIALSSPILLTNITNFILTQADIWILGAFQSQETVAIFGATTRLILLITMPLLVVNAVITPLIAHLHTQDRAPELEVTLRASAAAAMLPTLLIFFAYLFFGRYILEYVFGEYYQAGHLILVILCFGQMINGWAGSCGFALMMTGHQTLMMYISLLSGALMIGLGLLLVQPYGAIGVAIATSSGIGVRALALWFGVKKVIGIYTHFGFNKLFQIGTLRPFMGR